MEVKIYASGILEIRDMGFVLARGRWSHFGASKEWRIHRNVCPVSGGRELTLRVAFEKDFAYVRIVSHRIEDGKEVFPLFYRRAKYTYSQDYYPKAEWWTCSVPL